MAWILGFRNGYERARRVRLVRRFLVEPRRIELLTSCVQDRCSPS